MKKMSKFVALLMIFALVLSCAACSSSDNKKDEPAKTETTDNKDNATPATDDKADNSSSDNKADNSGADTSDADDEDYEEDEEDDEFPDVILGPDGKPVDLGGIEVKIVAWYANPDPDDSTAYGEATKNYREWFQKTYNCTVKEESIGSWNDYPSLLTNFCTTGGDENYVFLVDERSITGYRSGLYKDLTQIDCLDFTEEKWNRGAFDVMKVGDAMYGMRPIRTEPRGGVFFNKRLLQEAGIDPESLYDMQAAGTWDWNAFEELCQKLTRDLNGDDIPDVYAMSSTNYDFMKPALASNDAYIIKRDASGNFYNATGEDCFIQAWDWAKDMRSKYEMPAPEDATYDYPYAAFINADVALQVAEEYRVTDNAPLADDFGFVVFPKAPGQADYNTYSYDNYFIIPAIYDDDRAWKIAFAYNLYTNPTPGYEDSDDWKTNYYTLFRDTRSVDETLVILTKNPKPQLFPLVDNVNRSNSYFWNIDYKTGQEQYEEQKDEIDYYVGVANSY